MILKFDPRRPPVQKRAKSTSELSGVDESLEEKLERLASIRPSAYRAMEQIVDRLLHNYDVEDWEGGA